jgi:hypothetical protein
MTAAKNEREWARVQVKVRARFKVIDEQEAARLEREILARPSVWAPSGEAGLRELAGSAAGGPSPMLAQALLEISRQVVRLQARLGDSEGPMEPAEVGELSGGGGQLATPLLLHRGDRLELWFEDDDDDAPPVRARASVVHEGGPSPGRFGFHFDAIHPADRDRLIRFIYQVQRRALRTAHLVERSPP